MPTSADAIRDLEDSKKALEDQCAAASGGVLLKLLTSIQYIADEVGALEVSMLATAVYVPQTEPFKVETADARAFVTSLMVVKKAFAALGTVVMAIDKILAYVK